MNFFNRLFRGLRRRALSPKTGLAGKSNLSQNEDVLQRRLPESMEALAAVYRVRDEKTGQKKYGSVWLKKPDDAISRAKGAISKGEILEAVWWIDWRKASNTYQMKMGVIGRDDKPEMDVAASLRTFHQKPKGPSGGKPRFRKRNGEWQSSTNEVHPNVIQMLDHALAKAREEVKAQSKKEYQPPFTVYYLEERE